VFAFSLLALAPAARAQGSGGRWVPVPCDANGGPPPSGVHFTDEYFPLYGTETWTTTSTYFPATTSAAQTASVFGGIGDGANTGNYPSSARAENSDGMSPLHWWYSTEDHYSRTPGQTGYINGSVTVDIQGDLHAYYKLEWQSPFASAPTSPRPDHINLLLRTVVSAYVEFDYFSSGLQSGLSGTATATDGLPFGETASAGAAGGPGSVVGSHLVRAAVDPATGIAQVFVGGNLRWDATNLVRYGTLDYPVAGYPNYITGQTTYGETRAQASSGITARVRPDDREVAISSAIETSYFKSADEYSGSPVQAQHYRNPDGSIAVDSAVGWINVPGDGSYPKGWQINGLPITANATNFQNPSYAWSISGLTIDQARLELPLMSLSSTANFHLIEPDTNKFPIHCTVRVDVTDTDKAVAANTYDITWHLPYEKTALLGSVAEKAKLEKLYGPIGQGDFSDVQISAARDIKIDEGFELAGGIAAAVGQEEGAAVLEIIGKLAKLTDAKYHYAGENVQYGTQNGQDKWDATLLNPDWAANVDNPKLLKHFNDTTKKFDGWGFFSLEIYEVKHYHHMTWSADKYNSHGYDSSGYTLYADPVDKIDEEPYYTQNLFPNP